jgi:hypothetical protein
LERFLARERPTAQSDELSPVSDVQSSTDPSVMHQEVLTDQRDTFEVLEESCLIPLLEHYLRNESLLEIERHNQIYMSCVQVMRLSRYRTS